MSRPLKVVTQKLEPPMVAGKRPPADLDLEVAVLADVLCKGTKSLDEIASVVTPDDFFSDANANIYQACQHIADSGEQPSLMAVRHWLQVRDRLASVGGDQYLAQVIDAPATTRVRKLGKQLSTLRRVRKVIAECQRVAAEGYGDIGDPEEWLGEAEGAIGKAAQRADTSERMSWAREAITVAFKAIQDRLEGKEDPGLTTGILDLDRMLNGLRPGNVFMLGARSHIGKSSLSRQIACHVAGVGPSARRANGVLLWSGEQSREECAECMTFQQAGVPEQKRHTREGLTPQDWAALTGTSIELAKAPILLSDFAGITPTQLASEVRRAKRELDKAGHKLSLVAVDYVQLMSAAGLVERNANREREVAAISERLKRLAMEEQVVMLVTAQLNRDGDKRKDARPRPGDLRESNRLEQDSDKIVLIHNEHAEERMRARRDGERFELPETEEVELIVGKARGGGTMGTITVGFSPSTARFWSQARTAGDYQ